MNTDIIIEVVKCDCAFYGKAGGITLFYGEPMFQPEDAFEFLYKSKNLGITTTIETFGHFWCDEQSTVMLYGNVSLRRFFVNWIFLDGIS